MYLRVYFNHKGIILEFNILSKVYFNSVFFFFNLKVLQRLYWFTTHLFLARKKQGDGKKKGKITEGDGKKKGKITEVGNENRMDSIL